MDDSWQLICRDYLRICISYPQKYWKIFNIIVNVFVNMTPTSWVTNGTSDFLTCYSHSYYSFTIWIQIINNFKYFTRLILKGAHLRFWLFASSFLLLSEGTIKKEIKKRHISTRPSRFCRRQHFFAKNHHFLAKMVPLLKAIVWKLC